MTKKEVTLLSIFIFLLIVLVGLIVFKKNNLLGKFSKTSADDSKIVVNSPPTPTPFPPVPEPIPQGKQIYSISQGEGTKGPDMQELVIDPFDPKIGEIQTMQISVKHDKPVKSIAITLITDNKRKTYPLLLKEGTKTEGVWEGSWKTEDKHDFRYQAVIEAKDDINTSRVEPSFR